MNLNPNHDPQFSFKVNLERFAHFCPDAAKQIESVDCSRLQFCQTQVGELNLQEQTADKILYYHAQEGALAEANAWLEKIFPIDVNVICVYGIGLGYYYEALKSWLQSNPRNYLLFIEDDLAVLHRFLETGERAHQLLNDTQVVVQYFKRSEGDKWGRFRHEFAWFWRGFGYSSVRISALKLYQEERQSFNRQLYNQIWMNLSEARMAYAELFENQELCAYNYYSNFLFLPFAGQGIELKDKFPGVPLIICGAGPSLGKQLEKLPALYDKAFILGSGTGMNILTRRGIRPHFGLGLDPYEASESRFLSSLSYEIPFLFVQRFSHKALKIIHSPLVFLHGSDSFHLADWFKSELKLEDGQYHTRGITSSNASNSLGQFLGCNPIVLIGLDLAYTGDARYTSGAAVHPTSDRIHHWQLDAKHQNTIPVLDVHGETIASKWEWILEATFFTEFLKEHPETSLINATEGGLKIHEVPDYRFDEVIEKQLTQSYDLRNWLHCEVQNSYTFAISDEQMRDLLQKWLTSLEKCIEYCDKKLEALDAREKNSETAAPDESLSKQILDEMEAEPVFSQFMKRYNVYYEELSFPEMNKIKLFPDQYPPERRLALELEMNKGRLRFFRSCAWVHQRALNDSLNENKPEVQTSVERREPPKCDPDEIYMLQDGVYRIRDSELGLDFEEKFAPVMLSQEQRLQGHTSKTFILSGEGQALLFYPTGSIKGESYYSGGQLHGPSSFYAEDGTLLAKSWFVHGKRVGKTRQYYRTGELYSVLRYKEGRLHGRQEYYYPSGVVRTEMTYDNDLLDGVIRLYYPAGKLKREQHVKKGLLQGFERMWDRAGQIILEAEFNQNLPTGRSRTWHANGQLSKEIVFYDNPSNFDLRMWNDRGQLTHKQLSLPKDPAGEMLKKSEELQRTIRELTEKLKQKES